MRSKLIAAGVTVFAMALPATAMAGGTQSQSGGSGGSGQAQLSSQWSKTLQAAQSQAKASQNLVNTNAPVSSAGNDVYGGNNNATQNADNAAKSKAGNDASTSQNNDQSQTASPSHGYGSGGSGQAQDSSQWSKTLQDAQSQAKADQNLVNTNAPVSTAGNDVYGGNNNATQNADNAAKSKAGNDASTSQNNDQSQTASPATAPGPVAQVRHRTPRSGQRPCRTPSPRPRPARTR